MWKEPKLNERKLFNPSGLALGSGWVSGSRCPTIGQTKKRLKLSALLKSKEWRGSSVTAEGEHNVLRHPNGRAVMRLKIEIGG